MNGETQRQLFLRHQARHAHRCLYEARVVMVIITVALTVSSVILYTQGYVPPEARPASPPMIWGIPSWVMWGLVVPWLAMIAATWLFARFVMKDDEPYVEVPDALRSRDSNAADPVETTV